MGVELHLGDCRDVLRTLPDNSVDSIVTDPPYELGFMNKRWDSTGIAYDVNVWRECLRVLKPGGHLLAFGGSRTYHRLACAVEDAGFEIRDQIMWVYGSGFPKSLDVSKAIDKAAGAERERTGRRRVCQGTPIHKNGSHTSSPGWARPWMDAPDEEKETLWETLPATPDALRWQGWGTALKPAHEPLVMARKPLAERTVAANVLAWGCGALNVDGCRVEAPDGVDGGRDFDESPLLSGRGGSGFVYGEKTMRYYHPSARGRWPANLIHDGSEQVVRLFPETKGGTWNRTRGARHFNNNGEPTDYETQGTDSSTGSAARFFYCAKASKADRDEGLEDVEPRTSPKAGSGMLNEHGKDKWADTKRRNHHATAKPTDLMRYLCRLVTPPGGMVLDPFMGSGSTGKAAVLEGFGFVGIEKEAEYLAIAERRIEHARMQPSPLAEAAE